MTKQYVCFLYIPKELLVLSINLFEFEFHYKQELSLKKTNGVGLKKGENNTRLSTCT